MILATPIGGNKEVPNPNSPKYKQSKIVQSLRGTKKFMKINQLEKLEAARSAYLCLPFLTYPCLS